MSYSFEKYKCQICDKKSSQKSHHNTHINSEHHKDKTEIFKLKLEKESKKKLKKKYGYSEISKIMELISGIEPTYELKLQKKSNKVIYQLTKDELKQNKEYEEFKNKFKNRLKSWHNLLSGAGVTGDPALDDIIHIIMLCYLEENKDKFCLLDKDSYPIVKINRLEKYFECLSIKYILKNQSNLCKSKNTNDGKSVMEKIGEVLQNHNIFGKIVKDTNFINCKKNNVLYDLITNINSFCVEHNIFQYSDIIGITYEFWANEYKGSGGKELGNFFTERMLMRMCFEMIELDDIQKMKIDNNSTIGDEFCGTFGFPLYLKSFLKNKFDIDIKNKNIYGIEFEDRASRLAILNAMFSLGTVENIKRGDSFINNVTPHLDISVHNVPFGKRMKVKHIKNNYNDYKSNNKCEIPEFNDIIRAEANKDAVLASQMVIYKTSKIGLCIIKDGEESTSRNKSLVKYRKHICDTVNVKKILKIPSGAFSSTGTKTLCFYFINDGGKTDNIQFLELDEECKIIKEICNVSYEDLEHNSYLWSPNIYTIDEELEKMKTKSKCEWKKIGDICEFNRGQRVTKEEHDNNGKYYVIGGGYKNDNFKINTFNRTGFNCRIARYGGSEKNFIMKVEENFWLHDNAFTLSSKELDIRFMTYYLISIIKNDYYYKKLYNGNPPAFAINIFKNLQIPIPSTEIQKETVESIEIFDNMIKSLKSINDEHFKGIKLYMKLVIKKNLETIEWKKLKDISKIEQGTLLNKNKITDGEYPVIGGGKVIGFHSEFNRNGNEVVLTRVGNININFFENKYYLTDNGFSINSKYIKYIYYYLSSNNILDKYYIGSGQKVIAKSKLLNIEIPIQTQENEKSIIKYLDNIDDNISKNQELIKLYKENIKEILKQSYQ